MAIVITIVIKRIIIIFGKIKIIPIKNKNLLKITKIIIITITIKAIIFIILNQIQIAVIITSIAGFANTNIAIVNINDVSEPLLQIVLEKFFVIEMVHIEFFVVATSVIIINAIAAVAVIDARVQGAQSAIFHIVVVVPIFGLIEDEFLLSEHNGIFSIQTRIQSSIKLTFVGKFNETIAFRALRFLIDNDFEADDAFVFFVKIFFYYVIRNRFVNVPNKKL